MKNQYFSVNGHGQIAYAVYKIIVDAKINL